MQKERKPMVKLTNSFHNTSCYVRESTLEFLEDEYYRSNGYFEDAKTRAMAKRIGNKLCGSSDCCCGDFLGRRK